MIARPGSMSPPTRSCLREGGSQTRNGMDRLVIELDHEDDGRWIADVVALPGAMASGASREEAIARAEVIALRVLAERLEHGESVPTLAALFRAA